MSSSLKRVRPDKLMPDHILECYEEMLLDPHSVAQRSGKFTNGYGIHPVGFPRPVSVLLTPVAPRLFVDLIESYVFHQVRISMGQFHLLGNLSSDPLKGF